MIILPDTHNKQKNILLLQISYMYIITTLGVLIFAGTNFREFFSPYIRGYLFSRMCF